MKRRFFIITSLAALTGVGAVAFIRRILSTSENKALAQPRFLSRLCDQNTIRMLGRAYLRLKPKENKNEVLLSDLLEEKSPKLFLKKNDILIAESQIEKKIKQDFDTNNIVVVQGWVLSITEARQCAFFSIVSS
jgi:hypothetical protein